MSSLVSIITPSYNASKFIEETINSVLMQTYTNWELIIVDDSSVDNSVEIIESYLKNDVRIKLIQLEKNIGAAEARNIGLRMAKGRYIAFLDSDDIWMPQKLEKQLRFMQKKAIAFSFTAYQQMSADGKILKKSINAPPFITYNGYLKNTIIGCLTVIINRDLTGSFEMPNIKSSHDMALWLEIMKRGFVAYGINETLAKYRIVNTSNTANKWKAAKDVWKVYREIEKIHFLKSFYLFCNYAYNAASKRI